MKEFSKIDQLEKDEYYYSKEGYIIFTKQYHLKRGYCCNNNCKHCPYKKDQKKQHNGKY
tara:strand:- start:142 stop:318 length:177 start_codon:yes stop_codon:yes gene_type:complete